jgi:hypothetical protein
MDLGSMSGRPGCEQQRVLAALALPDGCQAGRVDLPLPGQEVQRGDGFLLVDREPDPLGVPCVPAPSGLAAAKPVVAQARNPVGGQPVGDCFERVPIGLLEVVAVGSVTVPLSLRSVAVPALASSTGGHSRSESSPAIKPCESTLNRIRKRCAPRPT